MSTEAKSSIDGPISKGTKSSSIPRLISYTLTRVLGWVWFFFKGVFSLGGLPRKTLKWYHQLSSKFLLLVLTMTVSLFGCLVSDPRILGGLSYVAVACLFVVVFRISEKAFDPLGSVSRTVEGFIALKQNPFFQMLVGFFNKKNKDEAKTNETAEDLDRTIKALGNIFKAPELMQNPKLHLGLFLANLIPIVAFTIMLFAVLYKTALVHHPNLHLATSDFVLISLYQFTGSSFHSLPELPSNVRWLLGAESLVAYYYSVILILAFGLTAQTHSASLGKNLTENLTIKMREAFALLPSKLSEPHTKKETDRIGKKISHHVELNREGLSIGMHAPTPIPHDKPVS